MASTNVEPLDPKLLEILACPAEHHAPVEQRDGLLVCTECGLRFPIRDGIPVMLLDEALPAL
ncbi:MAG: Trm112 family protein [Actinomycetes bacterium]